MRDEKNLIHIKHRLSLDGNTVRSQFTVCGVLLQGLYLSPPVVCNFRKEHYLFQEWSHSRSDQVVLEDLSLLFHLLDKDLKNKKHDNDYSTHIYIILYSKIIRYAKYSYAYIMCKCVSYSTVPEAGGPGGPGWPFGPGGPGGPIAPDVPVWPFVPYANETAEYTQTH